MMKRNLKILLLPAMMVTALTLSACNNISSASGTEFKHVTTDDVVDTDNSSNDITEQSISAEEQMIDNLTRHHWTLVAANDDKRQPLLPLTDIKDQVTLTFSQYQGQNAVSYTVGCNMVNAAYQLQGNTLLIENGMSTKMSCDDLNVAEDTLNQLMQGESLLSFVEGISPMLTQTTNDAVLEWRGKLTAQAKYNSRGETIFWAVSAETKPCINNNTQTCLQVKPITYDDQGIKINEGNWTEFSGSIDGYQHDSKHDEVLRLQRYQLDASSADKGSKAEKYAYVLDTVIESSLID